jgi:hypothetical protein
MARSTLTAKKVATTEVVNLGPWKFPKRSDFHFDFPKRTDFGLAALDATKGNAEGVSRSWARPEVRAARLVKNGVKVTFDGTTTEFKSVAEAFRALRLPFEKHIKFRAVVKAKGAESFVHNDKMYIFTIV